MTKREPPLHLAEVDDAGTYVAHYHRKLYRFMLSDGSTVDAWALMDDSWLRAAVVALDPELDIAGVAEVRAEMPEAVRAMLAPEVAE